MEILIVICVLACIVFPPLIVFCLLGLLYYVFWQVCGVGILFPILGLLGAFLMAGIFNDTQYKVSKDYKKAKKNYDDVVYRWYRSDEYWEEQERKQRKKKPNKATVNRAKKLLDKGDKERNDSKLMIDEKYLKQRSKQ